MDKITIDLGRGQKLSIENTSAVVVDNEFSTESTNVFDGDFALEKSTESLITASFATAIMSDLDSESARTSTEGVIGLAGTAIAVAKKIIATAIKALQAIVAWCKSTVTYIVQRIQGAYFKNMLANALKGKSKEDFTKQYSSQAMTVLKSEFTGKFTEEQKKQLDMSISLCEQYCAAINMNVNVNEVSNPDDEGGENDAELKTFYQKFSQVSGRKVDGMSDPNFLHFFSDGKKCAREAILRNGIINGKATIESVYGMDYLLALVMRGEAGFSEDFKHFTNIAKTIRTVQIKTEMVSKFAEVKATAIGKDNGGGKAEVKNISRKTKVITFMSQYMNEAIRLYLSYMQGAVYSISTILKTGKEGNFGVTPEEQQKYEGRANAVNSKNAARQNMNQTVHQVKENKANAAAEAEKEKQEAIARIDAKLAADEKALQEQEAAAKTAQAKAAINAKRKQARANAAAQRKQLMDEHAKKVAEQIADREDDAQ